MKKFQVKKRSLSVIAGVLSLVLIGGAWAYYSSTGTLDNKLSTKMPGGEQLVEEFTPDTDWNPGETVKKVAAVENSGTMPLVVRIKLSEEWTVVGGAKVSNDSYASGVAADQASFVAGTGQLVATDGLTVGDGSVVTKALPNGSDWVYSDADGYWYYNAVLAAGASTPNFLASITLNAATDMGVKGTAMYYTKAAIKPENDEIGSDEDSEWVLFTDEVPEGATFSRSVSSLESGQSGYAGSDYSLFITYETYQANEEAIEEATTTGGWDEDYTPTL